MLSFRDNLISLVWFITSKSCDTKSSFLINNIFVKSFLKFIHYTLCILFSNDLSSNVIFKGKPIIHHGIGIIVGSNIEFGYNVTLRAHVCLGEKEIGSLKGPTIGDNVQFGVGAKVFGNVCIKSGTFVKSNSIIYK